MSADHVNVVLVHGAWTDGSSWSKVIGPLRAAGLKVVAAPLPLTSLADDIAAVDRVLERLDGPVVLAGHAYAGAVIAETRDPKVASLVYIAGLAPDEGETVSDVFYLDQPHPKAPELKPDSHGLVWLPETAFADAFAQNASPEEQTILAAAQRPIDVACIGVPVERPLWKDGPSWVLVAEYDSLPKAMRILTDPADCGPVVISIPQDVQVDSFEFPHRFFDEKVWRIARPRADIDQIEAAAELIRSAKLPLIVAGGGALYSRAEVALAEFVEHTQIPVAETLGGKGTGPAGSPLNLGGLGVSGTPIANEVARDADLVISIGSRLTDYVTGSNSVFQNPDVQFIGINVNSADAAKCDGSPVVGDARLTIQALTKLGIDPTTRTRYAQAASPDELHRAWAKARDEAFSPATSPPLRQTELVGLLNDWLRPGDTLVTSAGTLPGDVFRYWEGREGTECHIEFGNSCMGYDIAGAIGVGLAKQSGEVFALLGDATFLLNPSDLAVAVQHGRKITVIVSDNQGMRSIRGLESRTVATPYANLFKRRDPYSYQLADPLPFDIAKIAEGFGTTSFRAEARQELAAALAKARDLKGPCVIVVKTDVDRSPSVPGAWWDIAPASVSRDGSLDDLRHQYEQARRKQRYSLMRFSLNAGQGCGATTRTFVMRSDYDAYIAAARQVFRELAVGSAYDPATVVGPLIRGEQRAFVQEHVDRAVAGGGTVEAIVPTVPDEGFFVAPQLIGSVTNQSVIAQTELFGPVGTIMTVDSVDEAVSLANQSSFGLNGNIWGPVPAALDIARRLHTGNVTVNGGGAARHDAPWGGYRESGIGREGGEAGLREFFEIKHIQWPT